MLPSDELVRVRCAKRDTRVRDVLRILAAKQLQTAASVANRDKQRNTTSKSNELLLVNGGTHFTQVFPLSMSDRHRAPLKRQALATNSGEKPVVSEAWELVHVRTGLGTFRYPVLVNRV